MPFAKIKKWYVKGTTTAKSYARTFFDFIIPPHNDDVRLRSVSHQTIKACTIAPQPSDRGIFVLYYYSDPIIRALVMGLKYRQQKNYAQYMGVAIARWYVERKNQNTISSMSLVIMHVPASSEGMHNRGYDQGALIAHYCTEEFVRIGMTRTIFLPHALARTDQKMKKQMVQRTRKERLKAMQNAFYLSPSLPIRISGLPVLIIDDVRTTGATLREAIHTVARARTGASSVIGIAFAQTPNNWKQR